MKTTVALIMLVALSAICILAKTIPECVPCSTVDCGPGQPASRCECGNYTTHCGCCHRCFKCYDEFCKPRLRDLCQPGYECDLRPSPTDDPNFDDFGTCKYVPTTPIPHE